MMKKPSSYTLRSSGSDLQDSLNVQENTQNPNRLIIRSERSYKGDHVSHFG
jgi:hypothetical protein